MLFSNIHANILKRCWEMMTLVVVVDRWIWWVSHEKRLQKLVCNFYNLHICICKLPHTYKHKVVVITWMWIEILSYPLYFFLQLCQFVLLPGLAWLFQLANRKPTIVVVTLSRMTIWFIYTVNNQIVLCTRMIPKCSFYYCVVACRIQNRSSNPT